MELIIPRFFNPPPRSYFLFGPRGTGKSTYLKATYPEAMYIDLLKPDLQRLYQARPESIIELVYANIAKKTFIIDEVQRVPELLSAIHSLIEHKIKVQFILTGSSARKLKRTDTNLLAGRVLLRRLYPFLFSELGASTDFDRALNFGLLPLITRSADPADTLNTYISLYIREEVQYEGFVRNIGNFSRFLEAISFSHASVLNVSNVARECMIERKVVENYISILEDIMLASRLQVFTRRAQRALVKHPKFYLFDTGVFRTLRPKGPLDVASEIDGAALEGLVFQNLKAWNEYSGGDFDLSYWRSRGGLEVDFVLYGADGFFAIEVKNSQKIRPEDLRSLREFKKDYPVSETVLIYRGSDRVIKDENVLCIPCSQFLEELKPGRTLKEVLRAT